MAVAPLKAYVFYGDMRCEVQGIHYQSGDIFGHNTVLTLEGENRDTHRYVRVADVSLFPPPQRAENTPQDWKQRLGASRRKCLAALEQMQRELAECDIPECEGHIYGFGCEWNAPGGWLCDEIDKAFGQEEEFEFCPRCGRDLRPDWAAYRKQRDANES